MFLEQRNSKDNISHFMKQVKRESLLPWWRLTSPLLYSNTASGWSPHDRNRSTKAIWSAVHAGWLIWAWLRIDVSSSLLNSSGSCLLAIRELHFYNKLEWYSPTYQRPFCSQIRENLCRTLHWSAKDRIWSEKLSAHSMPLCSLPMAVASVINPQVGEEEYGERDHYIP